jgi:hypothetical protein
MPEERGGSPLAAEQEDFARRLFNPDALPPQALKVLGKGPTVRRFGVYRNNVIASLSGVVKARFPVILRLLGDEFFAGVARSFVNQRPPRVPVLSEYGGGFAEFLESFEAVADLPYLADVARIEWLRHVAYHAPDREPLAAAELGRIPPGSIAAARLTLHPSAAIFSSPYPAVSIWETNTFDADVRHIGPELGGEAALIVRPVLDVALLRLAPEALALAKALAAGASIGEAFDRAADAAGADLSQALATLIGAGAFVDAEYESADGERVTLTSTRKADADACPR